MLKLILFLVFCMLCYRLVRSVWPSRVSRSSSPKGRVSKTAVDAEFVEVEEDEEQRK